MKTKEQLLKTIRRWILTFMLLLLISGITAFPLEWELGLLNKWAQPMPHGISEWMQNVYTALQNTNSRYPFMAYGTDWLAFAHIVIATVFIGPLKNPVRNV